MRSCICCKLSLTQSSVDFFQLCHCYNLLLNRITIKRLILLQIYLLSWFSISLVSHLGRCRFQLILLLFVPASGFLSWNPECTLCFIEVPSMFPTVLKLWFAPAATWNGQNMDETWMIVFIATLPDEALSVGVTGLLFSFALKISFNCSHYLVGSWCFKIWFEEFPRAVLSPLQYEASWSAV